MEQSKIQKTRQGDKEQHKHLVLGKG